MSKFLVDLAALSLGGAAAIILAALIRRFTKTRYAARWRCWVWLVLCLRLLIPISLMPAIHLHPISVSVPRNVVILAPEESRPERSAASQETVSQTTAPDWGPAEVVPNPAKPAGSAIRLYDVLGAVWMIGAAAVLLWAIGSHLRFLSYLRRWGHPVAEEPILNQYHEVTRQMGLQSPPQLQSCAGLTAPMLTGIFRNTILLPEKQMDSRSLHYTLLHELSHYRRRDIWLKSIALVVCGIHWFNPLVWYLNHLIAQDTELACDEALLRFLPREEYSAYCRTIMNSVSQIHDEKGVTR